MTSDDHPDHLDCPAINQVGLLTSGQNRETENLIAARTCGFHDHEDPDNSNLKGGSLSVDPLAAWRSEFPTVENCTYLVSHSLGRNAASDCSELAGIRRDLDQPRGTGLARGGWWEIGQTTGDLLAPILGVTPGSISMHQNVSVAMGIIASCFRYDGRRRKIVLTELEFPTNMYLFEGFARYGAEIVYVDSADTIQEYDLGQLLDAIDERTVLVPLSLVLFRSSASRTARGDRKGARSRGLRHPRRLPGRGHRAARDRGPRSRLRRRRLGQVAMRWARRRLSLRAARPGANARAGLIGWAAHAEPFAFATGPSSTPMAPRAFRAAPLMCPRSTLPAPAMRSSPRLAAAIRGAWRLDRARARSPNRNRLARQVFIARSFWERNTREAGREATNSPSVLAISNCACTRGEQSVVAFADGDFEAALTWSQRRLNLFERNQRPRPRRRHLRDRHPVLLRQGPFLSSKARRLAAEHDAIVEPLSDHHSSHGIAVLLEVEEARRLEPHFELADCTEAAVKANRDTVRHETHDPLPTALRCSVFKRTTRWRRTRRTACPRRRAEALVDPRAAGCGPGSHSFEVRSTGSTPSKFWTWRTRPADALPAAAARLDALARSEGAVVGRIDPPEMLQSGNLP